MRNLSKLRLPLILALTMLAGGFRMFAVPAKPGEIKYTMPDGQTVTVHLFGDERHHYFTTTDGYVLLRNEADVFHYAIPAGDKFINSQIIATDIDKRSESVKAMLAGIDKDASLKSIQAIHQKAIKKASAKVAPEHNLCSFSTMGSPNVLCILVEFSDKKFTVKDPHKEFSNQLNQQGYSTDGATGSIKDFFTASSNGKFTPKLDLYGPVTLPKPMSYYGSNDLTTKQDRIPYEMVIDACALLDDQIDFTKYDEDNDGIIDNVYLFYAGYGEADGGPSTSVWPHSWDIEEAAPGKDYIFDGKRLNHYACSNELRNGNGSLVAGIGVFCHEFSHVLGLPDLYSTNYSGAFTPGTWSLMDQGSYNNESRTPPLHTAYERYCFGWLEPTELKDPCNVTMRPISDIGFYDDAYIIKTSNPYEYYILENRQKAGWDKYLKGHGLLVWHINFVPDMWNMNLCNVSKQHIDVIEADNKKDYYTVEGDAFPGTANVTALTDDTTPGMDPWTGEKLHAPITGIKEIDGIITFMFKGGANIFGEIVANPATDIKAGGFTANWNAVNMATGYLLSVYTKTNDGKIKYVDGYYMKELDGGNQHVVTGLVPKTTYYYEVRATDGKFYSKESNVIEVTTLDATIDFMSVVATKASNITENSFVANWQPLSLAEYYTVNVYTAQLGTPFVETTDFTDNIITQGWETSSNSFDSRSAYSKQAPSLRLANDQYIQTRLYDQDVRSISFWHRGNTSLEENKLHIMGLVDGKWTELETIFPVKNTSGGIPVDVKNIPAGCRQVKISFERPTSGYVFLDDITIGYGGEYVELPLAGYEGLNAGNATSLKIEGLQAGKTYSYAVFGHNGKLKSKESARISVRLQESGAVESVNADNIKCFATDGGIVVTSANNIEVSVFNMSGMRLAYNPNHLGTAVYNVNQKGIYIVKIGNVIRKVVLR